MALSNSNLVSNQVLSQTSVAFGTSGARGLVEEFTPEVCAAYTLAFIESMKEKFEFSKLYVGIDNRPSSPAIADYCASALAGSGVEAEFCGVLPTPALAYYAMSNHQPCLMVTGSHIPFDRNGLKFYRPDGEITKEDELAILDANVSINVQPSSPLEPNTKALNAYIERYTSLYEADTLQDMHIGVYEHSSAGRDCYRTVFEALGAKVTSLGRSDEFVPIDTEAVSDEDKQKAICWSTEYGFDAIFSTDGDGDRPLIADEQGTWLRGDVLGLVTARLLNIEALAVPVSCNTAIEKSNWFKKAARTKIGSPYVIAEFEELSYSYKSVAGFEANGGFLLGSDIEVNGHLLSALPTRDAMLPAIALFANTTDKSVSQQLQSIPSRFTSSDRIKDFPRENSLNLIEEASNASQEFLSSIDIEDSAIELDLTDGLRVILSSGNIVHLRPSGNAPELRCYAEANSQSTADGLVRHTLECITKNFS